MDQKWKTGEAHKFLSNIILRDSTIQYNYYTSTILWDSSVKLLGSKRENVEESYPSIICIGSFQEALRGPMSYMKTDIQGQKRNIAQPREKKQGEGLRQQTKH